jgi:membrane protease subunit HflC
MRSGLLGILVLIGIGAALISNTFYTVSETEQAILLQFGAQKNVIRSAGLNTKIPFVQNVVKFDKRILSADQDSLDVPDKDRQRLIVDAFVRYQIVNPLKFYQTQGSEDAAVITLKSLLSSAVRNVIAKTTIFAVLSEERDRVMSSIKNEVGPAAKQFGIEVVDVRIRRTDLPPQNVESIVNRMVAERLREANELRAEGTEVNNRIKAQADRDRTILLAEANKQSEILQGEGDAERNRIYAEAYTRDPDFFAFYRSMIAYTKALGPAGTTMVISPTSEFFQYLGSERGK